MNLFSDYIKNKAKEELLNSRVSMNRSTSEHDSKQKNVTMVHIDTPVKIKQKMNLYDKIASSIQASSVLNKSQVMESKMTHMMQKPIKDNEITAKTPHIEKSKNQSDASSEPNRESNTDSSNNEKKDKNIVESTDFKYRDEQMYMNAWNIGIINNFIQATTQVWRCMHDIHIAPIKTLFKIDILDKKNVPLTRYVDYVKKIRDSQIRLPEWFILSNGTRQQKIIPCYDTEIDFMSMCLVDSHSTRGKTMMMMHTCESMIRNGTQVSDTITRNLQKAFVNPYCLSYMRHYSSSPEYCFMLKDHYVSYYEHIKHGLLEQNLKRIILVSARQIFMIIKILKEMRQYLVDEILIINLKRGTEVQEILYDEKYQDMKRIFEKLWPNLETVILLRHGGFRVHTERIRSYIGNVKMYTPTYAIPEATIGYDVENDSTYTLDPRKGYYEFIPIKSLIKKRDDTKSIRNLKIGELYGLVVSTKTSDVHRYVTGEIVRVTGYYNGSPKLEIICREDDMFMYKDKIITPYDIETILMQKFPLMDYCYRYTKHTKSVESKVRIYIELDESGYHKDVNSMYTVKQNIKHINILNLLLDQLGIDAEVRIVIPETFDMLYKNRYIEEIDPSFVQIPRLITDTIDIDVLKEKILFMF